MNRFLVIFHLSSFIILSPAHAADFTFDNVKVERQDRPADEGEAEAPAARSRTDLRPAVDPAAPGRRPYFDHAKALYRLSAYGQRSDGAPSRTFRPDKDFMLAEYQFGADKSFGESKVWEVRLSTRHTIDRAVSRVHDMKLTDLRTTLKKTGIWDLAAGDLVGGLTRYSFTRSFEGLTGIYHFRRVLGGNLDLIGHSGRIQREIEGFSPQFLRLAWGAGLDWRRKDLWIFPRVRMRAASSWMDDNRGTLDSPRGTPRQSGDVAASALELDLARVGGFDLRGASLAGEIATSAFVANAFAPSARPVGGWAVYGEMRYTRPADNPYWWNESRGPLRYLGRLIFPASSQSTYEEVERDFRSTLGSAAADQRRIASSRTMDLARYGRLTYASQSTRDDVEKRLRAHNRNSTHELRWNMKPFGILAPLAFWKKHSLDALDMTLGFRRNNRFRSDRTTNLDVNNFSVVVQHTLGGWRTGWDYHNEVTVDHARVYGQDDRRQSAWGVNASRQWNLERWTWLPPIFRAPWTLSPQFGYRRARDLAFAPFTTSLLQSLTLGLSIDPASRRWNFRTGYSWDKREQSTPLADSRRHSIDVAHMQKLPWDGSSLTLTYRHQRFNEEDNTRDLETDFARADLLMAF